MLFVLYKENPVLSSASDGGLIHLNLVICYAIASFFCDVKNALNGSSKKYIDWSCAFIFDNFLMTFYVFAFLSWINFYHKLLQMFF